MNEILLKKTGSGKGLWMLVLVAMLWLNEDSCKKYLEAKPDQTIATPSTIADLEGLLNGYAFINGNYPSASEVSSDDFYLSKTSWSSMTEPQRNFYTWQKYDNIGGDYTGPYSAIEYANVILESLPNISDGDQQTRNSVKGNALFIRASYHYALAQLFAPVYDGATAGKDLGIALRTTADIAVKPVRSTVAETYSSIITDLTQALPLLPAHPVLKYRASKPAAYGLIARAYLSMRDYRKAGLYADSALTLYNTLIDYNGLNASAAIPFHVFNDEVIYDARSSPPQAMDPSIARIDSDLYASYQPNDLRKTILFFSNGDGSAGFKGTYTGQRFNYLFTGIATNELYFIKAETAVRNGDPSTALQTLNTLLSTRWKEDTYVPYTVTDSKQLLTLILQERRKDLLFRTLRWTDLRRLNKEGGESKTLARNLDGTIFQLTPGSLRYVFEIDQSAVRLSGLTQNP
jgi:hypothetical protein